MSQNHYLFRASDAGGRRVTDRVLAGSAAQAMQILRQRGFQEIELLTDDVFSRTGQLARATASQANLDPRIQAELRHATPAKKKWLLILSVYRRSMFLILSLVLLFVVRRYMHKPMEWFDYATPVFLLLPLGLTLFASRATNLYRLLQIAAVEARYQELLTICDKLEPTMRKLGAPGRLDLATWRAKALMGLGRAQEAFAVMEAAKQLPGVSQAAYQCQYANFLGKAFDFRGMRERYEEAIRLDPSSPTGWMGLAELLAKRFGATTDAHSLADRVRQFTLSAQTREGLDYIDGMIALNEGCFDVARPLLEKFHARTEARVASLPLALSLQRQTEAFLAITCARVGDLAAANRYFAACREFLELHNDQDLLDRCRRSIASVSAT